MSHVFYRPRAPLDQLVEYLWATDGYGAVAPRERVLPSGVCSLIIHLGAQPVRVYADEHDRIANESLGGVLCGARATPLVLDTTTVGSTVGAMLKPYGARPLLDLPADALAERVAPLEAIWPALPGLRQRLLETPDLRQRVDLLEQALLHGARGFDTPPVLREALALFEDPRLASVAEVSHRTGLSSKRLRALFHEEVGLSPKAFWRVRRFRAALRDLDRGQRHGASLAFEHGYCDQPHFLREFRALAGSSPREYLAARVPGTDHVSIRVATSVVRAAG